MAVDFLAKRDIMESIIPVDSYNIARTSGVSGAWGSYGTLITAANMTSLFPGGFILCGMYISEMFALTVADGAQAGLLNVQVATGAAGSEVPVAEGHGGMFFSPGTHVGNLDVIVGITGRSIFFEPCLLSTGVRIAYRMSSSVARLMFATAYIFGYDARYFPQPLKEVEELRYIRGLRSPTLGATVWPSPGATALTTHAVNTWTSYGTPVNFIASAASPLLITGLFGIGTTNDNQVQAKIGIGGAGSEAWMSKVGIPGLLSYGGPLCDCWLPRPLYVKTGEAVSVAIAGIAGRTVNIALKGFALK